ncbi:dethiobiotin synthetase [Methylobacterium sp. Leaf104]|uniref:sensor domain-containing diguanylate cyclase n=1 Tax=Methylobacterium TaxID=407 RepID=UPI0006FA0EC5|nr:MULTISPECIES: sensor domain-containing diguanylate cyclase [Methylobacterium]KQP31868.1 dethiobiotin synthetase [Methylobacterium sp. Leaf104]MCI9880800.1 GGDEF domain-containing protein [Methylobacterium goesingense]
MRMLVDLAHRLRSSQTWIGLGILAPLGLLAISGLMLLDLRADAWEKATQTSRNLLQVIERDIARNIEIIDLSLRGVADNLTAPGFAAASPALQQLILFDRAVLARDMGVILVVDETGRTVFDAKGIPARPLNNADRSYFRVHRDRPDVALFISEPVVSRLLGVPVIVLSRRINGPDGRFGGVVQASLKLTYFSRLFANIALGTKGAINLYLADGRRLMRHPAVDEEIGVSVASAPTFQRFVQEGAGTFVGTSVRGDENRHHAFTRIGDLPLILDVALAAEEIEAEWRAKALVIGSAVLSLCGLCAGLSLLFGRELRHRSRIEAELARLSLTDALTGLPNRRRFEEALAERERSGLPPDQPLSLLVIDADHFKAVNDRHGHVGDEVLKGLAHCLMASARRPGDLVCRVGGEEFVLLLAADLAAARRVADRIHAEIRRFGLPGAGIPAGSLTVSIGLASTSPGRDGPRAVMDLYRDADAALYAAKADGRNRTYIGRTSRESSAAGDRAPAWGAASGTGSA